MRKCTIYITSCSIFSLTLIINANCVQQSEPNKIPKPKFFPDSKRWKKKTWNLEVNIRVNVRVVLILSNKSPIALMVQSSCQAIGL